MNAPPPLIKPGDMKHLDTSKTPSDPTVTLGLTPEWVLSEKYEELTGVTSEAVRMRRKRGIWLDGKHTKVVLRRIYVNIKEADKWISEQRSTPLRAF